MGQVAPHNLHTYSHLISERVVLTSKRSAWVRFLHLEAKLDIRLILICTHMKEKGLFTLNAWANTLVQDESGVVFTPWVPDMSLCTDFLHFALSDAILKLVHSRELWAFKAEDYLGTVTKTCVRGDPALTLVFH